MQSIKNYKNRQEFNAKVEQVWNSKRKVEKLIRENFVGAEKTMKNLTNMSDLKH